MQRELIFKRLNEQQNSLQNHRVFGLLKTVEDLRIFMSWHVFAVWDFMSLVKRLQRELTVVTTPWVPSPYPQSARLINEIVLGEESDDAPGSRYLSHYELYLEAMLEIGADTSTVDQFVSAVTSGVAPDDALKRGDIHPAIQQFVTQTLETAQYGQLVEVLGNFFFGREDIIPRMFQSLLDRWHLNREQAPVFIFYLERHIELDNDEHGPAALKMLQAFTEGDDDALVQLEKAAQTAIKSRLMFWDALADEIIIRQQALPLNETG
jgi:hypothetical protein